MNYKFLYVFSLLWLNSCNNTDKLSFCECFELEMQIQSESEGGDSEKADDLAKKRRESCSYLNGITPEEFHEKIKECE